MRDNGVEDGEHPLENEGLGAEKLPLNFPVFRGAAFVHSAAALFAAFTLRGFHEEGAIEAGGVVGGEVGGEEEVGSVIGESGGV